jgi:hypothetical protein
VKIATVEDFLKAKVRPEHRAIVAMLRALMRTAAPRAEEVVTYGILGWKGNRILAVVSPTRKDITFSFSRGAEFEDRFGLLGGVGKVSKYVKLEALDSVSKAALRYYIKQAVAIDAKR